MHLRGIWLGLALVCVSIGTTTTGARGTRGSGDVLAPTRQQPSPAPAGTAASGAAGSLDLPRLPNARPRNVVFILADDHRYDAMGFMGHPFLKTPHMDRLAREGVHLKNAFVTTALCSPSRATILTGMYAHQHGVVDNNNPVPKGTTFFPQYLQRAGYDTAFVGKWHMGGEGDDPQPGFDHWVSFRGQGTYLPSKWGLNVNGTRVPQKGYISDELTDYAVEWLKQRPADKPFFLYLSHKGVHAEFVPAERHRGRYADAPFVPPASQQLPPEEEARRPRWVRDQRNSWHGVDYPYHSTLDVAQYYRQYTETLLGVDDSIGRVLETLAARGVLDSTLVIYMGDNGFAFGEHGLIDKRTAYEESMRVPMLMRCPELFTPDGAASKGTASSAAASNKAVSNEAASSGAVKPAASPAGRVVSQVVANLDVAPTVLAAAGLRAPASMVGASLIPLGRGASVPWRTELLYEYYWEANFPQTPTLHALREARYKYIRAHGLWDVDELYDIEADPFETKNLIDAPEHQARVKAMNARLFALLAETGGLSIPLYPDKGSRQNKRRPADASGEAADFPPSLIAPPAAPSAPPAPPAVRQP
jgi:N-acetylglucosamine-6-sulfatase